MDSSIITSSTSNCQKIYNKNCAVYSFYVYESEQQNFFECLPLDGQHVQHTDDPHNTYDLNGSNRKG